MMDLKAWHDALDLKQHPISPTLQLMKLLELILAQNKFPFNKTHNILMKVTAIGSGVPPRMQTS